jgi:crotonobetainyl-CoA:carnitine CoA-transferase CaiB-like acyl-CoA transferase
LARHEKSRPKAAFSAILMNYFLAASEAALMAAPVAASAEVPAEEAAPLAASAEVAAEPAAEVAELAAAAAAPESGVTTTVEGAGVTAAGTTTSSFLLQAARAIAATIAAKTSDLFICSILEDI